MKRMMLGLIIIPLTVVSCYLDTTSDTSRVVMAVAAPPSANVARLHVAVFAGLVTPETLILKQTFETGSLVGLVVPSGPYRVFLIWAEDSSGLVSHYGASIPMNLTGENTVSVPMDMFPILTAFAPVYDPATATFTWNTIPGASAYEAQYPTTRVGTFDVVESNHIRPENYWTTPIVLSLWPSRFRAISSIFGLSTEWSNTYTTPR